MISATKYVLPIAAIASGLAGCASPPSQITGIPLDGGHAIYTLPAAIFADINAQQLERQYAASLALASRSARAALADGVMTGLQVKSSSAGVTASYLSHPSATMHNDYAADFALGISRQGDNIVVDVTCPSTLRVDYAQGVLPIPWKPLMSRDEAAADVRRMCNSAVLSGSRAESGEVNVPFPDAAVYANFARKLPPAPQAWRDTAKVSKDDLIKFKWFEVVDGHVHRVVGISVFPYRSGSKVTYRWEHSVACRPNVPCQFDAAAAEHMQELVSSIAND